MQRNTPPVTWLALTCTAVLCFATVARTDQTPGTNQQLTTREERMPKVGVDPGGVITGDATRLPNTAVVTLRIRFEAGARTIWHTHAEPQLLLVQEGRGRFQQRGGKIVELRAGETHYAPANIPHWHGAAPDAAATLLTVYPNGVKLSPLGEVTEDEYRGKTKTPRP